MLKADEIKKNKQNNMNINQNNFNVAIHYWKK